MEKKGYFPTLASLKGIYILLIVLHNTLLITPLFTNVRGIVFLTAFIAAMGNYSFFILSGFLLTYSYKERIQGHSISFGDFMGRRLKKLYPMYIISNFVVLIIEIIHYGPSAINLTKIIFMIMMVGGNYNNPTWFLCALLVCYVLYYGIVYFAKSHTQYLICIIIGVAVGYTLLNEELGLIFLTAPNGMAYMNFFLGCVLAEIYPRISEKTHKWLQPLFLVLLPFLLYLLGDYGVNIISGDTKVCCSFVLAPMFMYLALVKGPCSRILEMKWFVALGKISSSIFFWHMGLYFIFCDVYGLLTNGKDVQEPQYFLYLVLLLAFSAGALKLEDSIRRRKNNAKHAV